MKSKFTWIFTLLLAFFIQFAFAQEKTVTGTVTDATGMSIPGVNVKVVGGSGQSVQTDFDGNFSIQVSVNQKLEFSFVSMKTQIITVGASAKYNVQLEGSVLDEVVVEAFRTTTRATSNVAVTTITSKTIEGRPNANFIQTLQGQVPGLNITTGSGQPGANSTVILRGYGSVNGNVEPLYVIDGMPLNVDNFRSLNPNDIESLSVLKDAGATSIYGNRGANGVIVVKTKKGSFESPLRIKYLGTTSFTKLQDNKYDKMNSRQLLGLENRVGRGLGATLTQDEINNYGTDTDWYDQIFRTGHSQNHVLSFTSGGKNLSSFTSIGYFDQEGVVAKTSLQRFNFRNNMNGKSNNGKFDYSTAVTINYSKRSEASNLGSGSVNINPLYGANNGAPYLSPDMYTNGLDLYNQYTGTGFGSGTLLLSPLMLMDILKTGTNEFNELKMLSNFQANYKLTDDLTIGTTFAADYTQNVGLRVQDPRSFNSYVFRNSGEDYLGFQTESLAQDFSANINTRLNYNHTFGENHNIDASVFTEYYKSHFKSFGATQNGLNPKVFVPGNGAGYIGFNSDTSPFYVPDVSSSKITAGLFSYFGSVNYSYADRFGLGLTARRDASYRFSETNRWGTFWSVDARWNIDREKFMEGSVFNMLKLRGSYGTAGNQNIAGQSIYSIPNGSRTLFASGSGYANLPAYVVGQLGNADLKWETIAQGDVGVDFEVFDSKLRGTFDVYRKTTKDLYQSSPLSAITGQFSQLANNGSLRNSGIELLLAYDVIKTTDFTLTLSGNGSYNKNEFVKLPTGDVDNGTSINTVGGQINQYYVIPYVGVSPATGNLLFRNAEGGLTETPDNGDRRKTGKSYVPKYQGGFGLDANYKGFYLTAQFSYVQDVWRFDSDLDGLQNPASIGVQNKSTDLERAWTPDNRYTTIPSLTLTNKGFDFSSDRYLKDASYVRLRYTSIGYTFPAKTLAKTPFAGLKAYFQAENLYTWTKWRGWDAESPRSEDVYQYPTPKIFSVGLEVQL